MFLRTTRQGLFEAMDLCTAMNDTTCVITLFGGMSGEDGHAAKRCAEMEFTPPKRDAYGDRACDLSSEAYGDLVEYCYGNAATEWGRKRIVEDGHPEIYNVTHFELGSESAAYACAPVAVTVCLVCCLVVR